MRYRILGRTGLKVSELGMGGISAMGKYGPILPEQFSPEVLEVRALKNAQMYPVSKEAFGSIMSRASELGINFLDTAPAYGDSEVVFGHYLREHRDNWIVCTKIGTCGSWGTSELMSKEALLKQFSQSKKRLQIDYVDLVLVHSIEQYGRGEAAVDRLLMPGGMVDVLRELQKKGEIGYIGVSGFLPEITHAVRTGVFDVVLTHNTFNLLVQEARKELFPLCREKNIGIILAGAFYHSLLAGNPEFVLERKEEFLETEDPVYCRTEEMVQKIERLTKYVGSKSEALRRLALRFSLSDHAVSVLASGMKSIQELEENVRILEDELSTDDEMSGVLSRINESTNG